MKEYSLTMINDVKTCTFCTPYVRDVYAAVWERCKIWVLWGCKCREITTCDITGKHLIKILISWSGCA